jgi:hypothetical protein
MDRLHDLTITFANGVEARLLDLNQHSTYEGRLGGGSIHLLNEEILAECTLVEGMIPVRLVQPDELWVEGDHSNVVDAPVPLLPGLQCKGLFDVRGRWLRIAWFQESWSPTIDPLVQEELGNLDFMELSIEGFGEL